MTPDFWPVFATGFAVGGVIRKGRGMTDYTELCKRLRGPQYDIDEFPPPGVQREAADAIEALQAEIERLNKLPMRAAAADKLASIGVMFDHEGELEQLAKDAIAAEARAEKAEAELTLALDELRATDPNYTPLLDSYAANNEKLADWAEKAEAQRDALAKVAEPFANLYIGVSMNDDAKAAYTVIGDEREHKTFITAGEIRALRAALDAIKGGE